MHKKRLGIFVIYNAQGKVENYVSCLLSSMYGLFSKLVIVVNETLNNVEADKLRKYSQNIFLERTMVLMPELTKR